MRAYASRLKVRIGRRHSFVKEGGGSSLFQVNFPAPDGKAVRPPASGRLGRRSLAMRGGLALLLLPVLGFGAPAAEEMGKLPHPRLWLTRAAEAEWRTSLRSDPLKAKMQAAVLAEADNILTQRVCRYEMADGVRLLRESRLAVRNVLFSVWAWRSSGEEKYRIRALAEIDAACAFQDWHPAHFLDTAEMATAVAIGYDWLYPTLDAAQRARYERALVEKALQPAKTGFDEGIWWSKPANNWAQVCGAGIALAAAAVAGADEGLSEPLFTRCLALVEKCGAFYQPDGMYPEGPGYWQYGTSYHTALLAACGPLGVSVQEAPELRLAGLAMLHLTSPGGLTYNFADGTSERAVPTAPQCWLARHFKDAKQSAVVRAALDRVAAQAPGELVKDRLSPLAVLWLPAGAGAGSLPPAAVFGGQQAIATFRSGWDPKSAYLAIKGGTPAASHGQMDVGSFVYDAHGRRWLHDLGPDNYNLPGYFKDKRWTYYRLQNRSHNTLEIGGALQDPKSAACPLVASTVSGPSFQATFDLTSAYAGSAEKVVRGATFESKTGVVVLSDRITRPAGEVVWRAVTDSEPEIQGASVTLRKGKDRIVLKRLSKVGEWSVEAATPPTSGENPNKSYKILVLTAPRADSVNLVVEIRP